MTAVQSIYYLKQANNVTIVSTRLWIMSAILFDKSTIRRLVHTLIGCSD
jgi:hypothetical protein